MKHILLVGLLSLALATGAAFAAEEKDEPGNDREGRREGIRPRPGRRAPRRRSTRSSSPARP